MARPKKNESPAKDTEKKPDPTPSVSNGEKDKKPKRVTAKDLKFQ